MKPGPLLQRAPLILTVLIALSGCEPGSLGGEATYTLSGEGGASSQSAAASGDFGNNDNVAEIAWDPVWHKTTPIDWPLADPVLWPGCGEGCRSAQSVFARRPSYYDFNYDLRSIVEFNWSRLTISDIATGKTRIIGPSKTNQIYVAGNRVSYSFTRTPSQKEVLVMDLITGETKVVAQFHFDPKDPKSDQSIGTALSRRYVYWITERRGFFSRDLQTGEVRHLYDKPHFCYGICATERELICATDSAYILRIDAESGKPDFLDWGQNAQIWGYCSPDRKQFVWIDFRDPPGEFTEMSVTGGEVYLRDLEAQTTRRLTFDSPQAPRRKFSPAAGDKYIFWREEPEPFRENFDPKTDRGLATVLVRYELETGRKCRLASYGLSPGASYGSQVLRYFTNPEIRTQWHLVMWDSEHPSRQWVCND